MLKLQRRAPLSSLSCINLSGEPLFLCSVSISFSFAIQGEMKEVHEVEVEVHQYRFSLNKIHDKVATVLLHLFSSFLGRF